MRVSPLTVHGHGAAPDGVLAIAGDAACCMDDAADMLMKAVSAVLGVSASASRPSTGSESYANNLGSLPSSMSISQPPPPICRFLDGVELFAGSAGATAAFKAVGREAVAYDRITGGCSQE